MATSNKLGMYLPTRDDYISVKRDISDNLAILDAAAGDMDIIINGNTASENVTSGQFVTVLNSTITGVTDGIYKAVANVAAGVPFVAANLSAPTSGALNELVEQIGTINSNLTLIKSGSADTNTFTNGVVGSDAGYYKDISNPVSGKTPKHIIVSLYNTNTANLGFLTKVPFASGITANGFRIWSPFKGSGYYVHWIAVY